MKRLRNILPIFWGLSLSTSVESQQLVQLSTSSANMQLTLPNEPLTTHQVFQFESTTSKLFHNEIKNEMDKYDAHAVITSVYVQKMKESNVAKSMLTLDSVVSVTFSQVSLNGALNRGINENTRTDIATILTTAISVDEITSALIEDGIVTDTVEKIEVKFSPFNGSINERGMYATDIDLISAKKDTGWPMFIAGVIMSFLFCSIAAIAVFIYFNENGVLIGKPQNSNKSVHYEGDVDVDVATTASGVLGLKGHHPQAIQNDENAHPNRKNRKPRKGSLSVSKPIDLAFTVNKDQLSPMTQQSTISTASRYPLGITSMRKLSSFSTPKRPKSDRVPAYSIDVLNYTSNSVLKGGSEKEDI